MTLEGIGKRYGGRPVLSGLDLTLEAGEKLVVVGRNGTGKTTLLRILAGVDSDFEGSIQYGAGIQPGYFSQDAAEAMTGSQQVVEYLEKEAPTELVPRVRDMLGAFLFRGDDVHKPIPVLSGGEKSRLALLRMLLKPMNLLILDEPTNHLDLHSKDILLDTLKKYQGTIIFVSHDRAFMEALSTKTLELSARSAGQPAAARLFYGDYGYYLDRISREAASGQSGISAANSNTAENGNSADESAAGASFAGPPPSGGTLPAETADPAAAPSAAAASLSTAPAIAADSLPRAILLKAGSGEAPLGSAAHREQAKQRQALIRRLEREEGEILKRLETLETEKAALEAELARRDVYSNGEKARTVKARLDGVTAELEGKGREWESKAEELEKHARL
jgi:ATP-binding cassette subfamily F protein 3